MASMWLDRSLHIIWLAKLNRIWCLYILSEFSYALEVSMLCIIINIQWSIIALKKITMYKSRHTTCTYFSMLTLKSKLTLSNSWNKFIITTVWFELLTLLKMSITNLYCFFNFIGFTDFIQSTTLNILSDWIVLSLK